MHVSWYEVFDDALSSRPVVAVRHVAEAHLGRPPTRSEITSARRAANTYARGSNAQTLRTMTGDRDRDRDGVIVIDGDLPPHTLASQLTGLHEVSAINQAVGMLIDRGHDQDDAHAALRRHAAAAGVDTHISAARILRR